MLDDSKSRLPIISALLVAACILTYYFRKVLGTGVLFTHFFYIPIILACVWWRRRGLVVTTLLILVLTFGQHMAIGHRPTTNDYLRALMMLVISALTVALSEKLAHARSALAESERKYRTIFENTGTAMVIIENDKTISLMNREFEKLSGFAKEEVEGKKSWSEFVHSADRGRMEAYHHQRRLPGNGAPTNYEFGFDDRNGDVRHLLASIDMIPGTLQSVASFLDITEQKKIREEQRILEQQLSNALEKALSGFIPICANCKKIRDENENWIQIESFLKDRTSAEFSHSICPDCKRALYPELYP
ncbi:MAG: PAS domain S-box protein [Deltaproteobacteria bacterium]|nr:PAS domain S-box protein [Deltaproteobacteria bacterium]